MTDQVRKYLFDILSAIDLIEAFTAEVSCFEEYINDLKTQSAVERQLGIIGEAAGKYEQLFPQSPLINTKQIRGFRNRIIHAYDSIDPTVVWAIIKNHLSPLKAEVQEKLQLK
jgi:uncharacterized protein with HEPN domain